MPIRLAEPPLKDDVMDDRAKNRFTFLWQSWLRALVDSVTNRVQFIASVSLPGTRAGVALTAIQTTEPLPVGLYRATVTSLPFEGLSATASYSLTIYWTYQGADWGVVLGNRVFADGFDGQSNMTLMKVDAGTTIRYSVSLNPGTDTPSYAVHVDIALERLQ